MRNRDPHIIIEALIIGAEEAGVVYTFGTALYYSIVKIMSDFNRRGNKESADAIDGNTGAIDKKSAEYSETDDKNG